MKGMTHNHKNCLKNMLDFYKIVIPGDDNKLARSVTSAIIKEFIDCLWLDDEIANEQRTYVQQFDVAGSQANHQAFYDIISRWIK